MAWNAAVNLAALGQDISFGFLGEPAGYDINQQLMKKILDRLEEQHAHLQEILMLTNIPPKTDKSESPFLEGLKHIIDLEDSSRKSQAEVDELFEDFDSFDL